MLRTSRNRDRMARGEMAKNPREFIKSLELSFDEEWYEKTYTHSIMQEKKKHESLLDFYVRRGARIGHDPNDEFSEILYRAANEDVKKKLMTDSAEFAFKHFIEYGIGESNRISFTAEDARRIRTIYLALDREFIKNTYGDKSQSYIDVSDYYFDRARQDAISPSADFSEAGYLDHNKDVSDVLKNGDLYSAFDHFLRTRGREMRSVITHNAYLAELQDRREAEAARASHIALEASLPGITHLTGLDMLNALEFFDSSVDAVISPSTESGGILVLVPHFLPEILFGGYMAFYDFLAKLRERTGAELHLLVVNQGDSGVYTNNLLRMRLKAPNIFGLFSRFQKLDPAKRRVEVPENFLVMSYCAELHPIASRISRRLGREPVFFIQEEESDFHSNNDLRSFTERSFLLPHIAVYNSAKLVEYFRVKTSVFEVAGDEYRYASIENPISPLPVNRENFLKKQRNKTTRRLIMYGRPEGHAARNHFATLVFALRQATRRGIFLDEDWEFYSIGSLAFKEAIDLNGSSKLRMLPKMPKADYEDFLLSGDVGVSVITTPHPGIVHFQMAAYGLTTVTNRTDLRDDLWLSDQNRNLVPVDMTVESIVSGFQKAVAEAEDFEKRYDNAFEARRLDPASCVAEALFLMAEVIEEARNSEAPIARNRTHSQ
ncbi:rhamnosyltransferase WsaF family glycosyltransferase [Pseudooceanicola nanhaiensis]|nr:hypothetical protein [Pseudooceanicola nanhaiensis]